jgi:glycerophosphoryl diester phosphodiesterase
MEIIAHRGSSQAAPENTIAAIAQAIADGADRVELDVQELGDGTLAILHDLDLRRVAGCDRPSWSFTRADLAALDVGRWFAPEFAGAQIPTLAEVLAFTGDRIALNLELKAHGHEQALVERTIATIRAAGASDRCVLTSFHWDWIAAVTPIAPEIRAGCLAAQPVEDWSSLPGDLYALPPDLVTPAILEQARSHDRAVWVWTVDDPEQAIALQHQGVAGLITNQPARIRAACT